MCSDVLSLGLVKALPLSAACRASMALLLLARGGFDGLSSADGGSKAVCDDGRVELSGGPRTTEATEAASSPIWAARPIWICWYFAAGWVRLSVHIPACCMPAIVLAGHQASDSGNMLQHFWYQCEMTGNPPWHCVQTIEAGTGPK